MISPEVLVVGAGPAGIAAAVRASECGRNVLLLDDNLAPGGQIWRGDNSSTWLRRLNAANVSVLSGAQVLSADAVSKELLIEEAGRARQVRFQTLILATGARERFIPFPGWTLPGVMGVGGLQALAKSGMPVAGKRVVIGGTGPLLLAVAAHLKAMGAEIVLLAEQASVVSIVRFSVGLWRYPGKLRDAVSLRIALAGVPYRFGSAVVSASGNAKLEGVTYIQAGKRHQIACDYAGVAYGLCPNVEVAASLGCNVINNAIAVNESQQTSVDGILAAGECTGIGGSDLSIAEGQIAGYVAGDNLRAARRLFSQRSKHRRFAAALDRAFALRPEIKKLPRRDTIICRCEDVKLAELEAMRSFRAAKLHTRCGMGPCQGRVCGPALQFLFGWQADSVRPPTFPARISSLIIEGEDNT